MHKKYFMAKTIGEFRFNNPDIRSGVMQHKRKRALALTH